MSWVISGMTGPANQNETTRSTLMKVMASPAPTRTRAATAVGTSSASASTS